MKNEIIIYQSDELSKHIEVRIEEDTVWLNRQQIAQLFDRDVKTIGKHISNVVKEELVGLSVVAKFATTASDGKIYQTEHYNLDVIISIGYRVKSQRGIQFRLWANGVLKNFLLKGYALNRRMNRIEDSVELLTEKIGEIELHIKTHKLPIQGVFFNGQVFDAYELTSRIIRSAKKRIILIDNYVDESTFVHLSKRNEGVKVLVLTKQMSAQLDLDASKVNGQYGGFEVKPFNSSHDRFLIIDDQEIYHLGASLKDLGKRWFAFQSLDGRSIQGIMEAIKRLI